MHIYKNISLACKRINSYTEARISKCYRIGVINVNIWPLRNICLQRLQSLLYKMISKAARGVLNRETMCLIKRNPVNGISKVWIKCTASVDCD